MLATIVSIYIVNLIFDLFDFLVDLFFETGNGGAIYTQVMVV